MRHFSMLSLVVILGIVCTGRSDDAVPPTTGPGPEHEWLEQLTGQWKSESEITFPGLEPMSCTGTENARMLGELWLVAEGEAEMMGHTMNTMLTLGYDPTQEMFVGSWVDSGTGYLWTYEGTLDERTKTLTLDTQGPCPFRGGEMTNFRETLQIVDEDHKVFTSSFENEDGSWQTFMTVTSERVE